MRVGIVGAGVAGLTAALEIQRAGHQAVVFEVAGQAGGLASGFRDSVWSWPLERFYHHIFEGDAAIRAMVDDIGFRDKLFFASPVTAQWWRGKGYTMSGGSAKLTTPIFPLQFAIPEALASGLSVLGFPALAPIDRVRLGLVIAYLKYGVRDWRRLEKSTAAEWTRRWLGGTVYRDFVAPLLEGKFGPRAEEVNMAWLWARFKARSFRLGYFVGGFQGFVDALVSRVERLGASINLGIPVAQLEMREDGRWRIMPAQAGMTAVDVDAVVVTGAPALLAKLVPTLPPQYLASLQKLRSMGAVVLILALDRQLTDGVYWMNLPKEQFPFLALVEHTNFVSSEHYGGDRLIYCGDYLDPGHEYFRLSKDDLLDRFLPSLKKVNPAFDRTWLRASWLCREPYAQPIVPVGHSANIPPLSTPVRGIFWASMSQVYPWDRGTNYAVELGVKVAREALRSL